MNNTTQADTITDIVFHAVNDLNEATSNRSIDENAQDDAESYLSEIDTLLVAMRVAQDIIKAKKEKKNVNGDILAEGDMYLAHLVEDLNKIKNDLEDALGANIDAPCETQKEVARSVYMAGV